jgi:hypothetical protein
MIKISSPTQNFAKKLLARTTVSKESLCSCAYRRVAYHVQLEEIAEMCGRSDTATPAGLNFSNKQRPGLSLVPVI